jgi:rhodanese-related sulfurtransferase
MNFISNMFSAPFKEIGPQQLGNLPEGTRLIDVRQPEEFDGELGHLSGAELVPLATLQTAAQSWDRSKPYLLICRSGGRSSSACGVLHKMGFSDITNLRGGMSGVRLAG